RDVRTSGEDLRHRARALEHGGTSMRRWMSAGPVALQPPAAIAVRAPAQETTTAARLPSITLPRALDRVLRDYERAWQAKDAEALAGVPPAAGSVLHHEQSAR